VRKEGVKMETLGTFKRYWHEVRGTVSLCGCTEEFAKEVQLRFRAVGEALMKELGISDPDEAGRLPASTPLGAKSQAAFDSLKVFFEQERRW